ncbi:MAG: glycosyltransferase [Dehalococcoidia bacterium]|nr:glycosyltransferase [Dehalococcoidia bacterium]
MAMRIALYHPWTYLRGGIERTLLELVKRSRHDWTLFTSRYDPEGTFPGFKDLRIERLGEVPVKRNTLSVARACLQVALSGRDWSRYDALMVSNDGISNLLALRSSGAPLLSLCHTPLKVAHDEKTRARWLAVRKPGFATRAAVSLFAALDRPLWRRYQHIFCVSGEVERRLLRSGLARQDQTEVVHPGVDAERLAPSGRREPFFLVPGRIMWTKNIELAIEAFLDLKLRAPATRDYRLVIAGMVDEKSRPYLKMLRELSLGRGDIEFVVRPSDEELFDLYDRCFAVLFTPPNEDWGIVPLEAMAAGKPVVSVASGGPQESIADGETGFLVPSLANKFTDAMERLTREPELYQRMSAAGPDRARLFSWGAFVGRIDSYIDGLAEPEKGGVPALVRG